MKRDVRYDKLRILACIMVILIHVSSSQGSAFDVHTASFAALYVWNAASRSAVAIFFMISGALFLGADRPPDIRRLWTKNIPRLLCAYVVWSLLYGLKDLTIPVFLENPAALIGKAIEGHYHLWFLPSMLGIYVLLPLLYAAVHNGNGRILRYFVRIFAFFGIFCGTVNELSLFLPESLTAVFSKIRPDLCGACGYFILGYALARIPRERLHRWLLIGTYALAVAAGSVCGILYSRHVGAANVLFDEFSAPGAAAAVSLFLLFRTLPDAKTERSSKIWEWISAHTLGIYLLHPLMLAALHHFGFHAGVLPTWIGVPLLAAAVFVLCFAVIAVLRIIPGLGKWLV